MNIYISEYNILVYISIFKVGRDGSPAPLDVATEAICVCKFFPSNTSCFYPDPFSL